MNAVNCPRCGKIFAPQYESICPACLKEEEHIFDKVRDFVKEFPNKSVKEVAEECEVTVKRIMQYIRDGRIEAGEGMQGEIRCSQCNKPIKSGRMCDACVIETNNKIGGMKHDTKKGSGFHMNRK